VVDDEPDLRFILRRIFEKAGFEVQEAEDGEQALEKIQVSPPDLVVTDMMMPIMGGAELIRRLHADPATVSIPILAVTGDAHLASDADSVLKKPYRKSEIVAAATALLSREEDLT
jgi:CheY-like chemotaxis protein